MAFLENLVNDLLRDECKDGKPALKPYYDNAKPPRLTIGVGHNLTDKPISNAAAYFILHEDIDEVFGELDHALPWWRGLDEPRQRVIANMAFNMGAEKLLGFRNTLSAIKRGLYVDAARAMLKSLWAEEVGARAHRLADLMDPTGAYKIP